MIRVLAEARWLNGERARIYCRMLAVAMLIIVLGRATRIGAEAIAAQDRRPGVTDFVTFWAGANLAAHGHAASAYDVVAIAAAETRGARFEPGASLPYFYPPMFLLLSLPLAAMPYLLAMAAFLAAGYAATSACLKKILPPSWPWLPVLAMPGTVMNLIIGQNGFISATCFAGALLLLERRPACAGACLGVLAYKPHLAIFIPVALAAARRWRALCACAATALALACLSWLAFGTAPWIAFFRATRGTLETIEAHPEVWTEEVSVLTAIRILHGGLWLGYVVQAASMVAALFLVARCAWRRPGAGLEISVLVTATFLGTPYGMDYDLVCLGVPMAWLAAEAAASGWRDWEKLVLLVCYVLPLLARWLNIHAHLPLMPFAFASLLALLCLRVAARDEKGMF